MEGFFQAHGEGQSHAQIIVWEGIQRSLLTLTCFIFFSRWGRRHHQIATAPEMLTAPRVLGLGQLSLLNKYSSSHTLLHSRAALEAHLWSAGIPLCSAACGLSLQKCMAEAIKFWLWFQVPMPRCSSYQVKEWIVSANMQAVDQYWVSLLLKQRVIWGTPYQDLLLLAS